MLMNNRSQYNTVGGQTMLNATAPSTPNLPMWVQANYLNFSVSGYSSVATVPRGYPMQVAYIPAQRAGAILSRERTTFGITGSMAGYTGVARAATSTLSINGTVLGQLTAGAVATGTLGVSGLAAITGYAVRTASGSFGITGLVSTNDPGYIVASGTISISGAVTPYGVGLIVANSAEVSEFSAANLAAAVWNASATGYNGAGSMGEKLNDAGSASNPWTEVIESGLTAAEVLRIIAAFAAGNASGLEGATPVFKGIDGTTDRITATYSGGTRTVTSLDGT
jgi:hypothetical protein